MGDPKKVMLKKNKVGFDLDSPMLREVRIRRMAECGRCGWNSDGIWKPCSEHKMTTLDRQLIIDQMVGRR